MNFLLKLFYSLDVFIKSKRSLFSLFKKGSSVASTQIINSIRKYDPSINTIIDVGANQGQFALASVHFFPGAKIYSFEPVPDTFKTLQANTKKRKNINIKNFALGSTNGTIDFYSNGYSHASSALKVSEIQKKILPKTGIQNKIQVEVKMLDDVLRNENLVSPILLKLDVQGFEKEVLKGGLNFIKEKVDYLLFETSFISMYDGEPLFDEMHSFVKELGFELMAPVGFLQTQDLQILQLDMLYKKKQIKK